MSEEARPGAAVGGEEAPPAHVLAPSAIGAKGRHSAERRLRSARGHLDAVVRMLYAPTSSSCRGGAGRSALILPLSRTLRSGSGAC